MDPIDYQYLGYNWRGQFYFDLVLPFGGRSATMACQRATNAVAYIFKLETNCDCTNYVDDFDGVSPSFEEATRAFDHLELLFQRLGLQSSPAKDCPPSTRMVFLGLIYDTVTMTIEVPPDKLESICALLDKWLVLPRATKSELQSLIGKLAFVCACISPERIFIQRMLHDLRQL